MSFLRLSERKLAVLSMDVEDWYHTGYLKAEDCAKGYSMLDGLDLFGEILGQNKIPAQLFTLADLLKAYPEKFRVLARAGHEIASHGASHIPPLKLSLDDFKRELDDCQAIHREVLGRPAAGFRAARFMIDRERLNLVRQAGFVYDSSLIYRRQHMAFDWQGYSPLSKHILRQVDFYEFRPCSLQAGHLFWPIAGGGAFRILPWWMSAVPLKIELPYTELYSFYIHPIDISPQPSMPPLPPRTGALARWRMQWGRSSTAPKLEKLIRLLKSQGFEFTTYSALRAELTSHQSPRLQNAGTPA